MSLQPRAERFESLDMLRGLAVLGILLVNIQVFAMPFAVLVDGPAAFGSLEGGDGLVWRITDVFFTAKFYTIFSALFGAGILLFLGEDPDKSRLQAHRRRMAWLLLIGMIHAYVFWYGDILVPYAVLGFIVVFARGLSARLLLIIGSALVLAVALAMGAALAAAGLLSAKTGSQMEQMPPLFVFTDPIAAMTAPWGERIAHMAPLTALAQVSQLIGALPKLGGIMLVGMGLYKAGFFTLRWSAASYLLSAALAGLAPLAALWLLSGRVVESEFSASAMGLLQGANEPLSALIAFAYASLVMALCKLPGIGLLRLPFVSAGRMAFSNYLGTTAVCVFLFYGPPGLAWFGETSRLAQAQVTLLVWAGILAISTVWMAVFRFGPMEWLWRTLTYGRLQPIFHRRAAS